ncbi:RNA-dependent RNA polymerase [Wenzhou Suncus murinus thottimvirus 1]|nr:RNA-dependent RNA polymerase [Wenzhou Suncus murinus thottimvirus 1]
MQRYYEIRDRIHGLEPGGVGAIECIDLLDSLYAIRHDLIDEMIKHDWSDNKDKETPISDVLIYAGIPLDLITGMEKIRITDHPTGKTLHQFFKSTPDNYKIEGTTIKFIEVTVTVDVEKGIYEKKKKYQGGFNQIQVELDKYWQQGKLPNKYTIVYDIVAVKADGSNLSTQWPSTRSPGVVQHMRMVQAEIQYVRERLIRVNEKSALESMFNLKFHTHVEREFKYVLPEYPDIPDCEANQEKLLTHLKAWLTKKQTFSFHEVTGEKISQAFREYEAEQESMYPKSRKPRNFLLLQIGLQSEYNPMTISMAQVDTKLAASIIISESPETPVQALVKDVCYNYMMLDNIEINNYYSPAHLFDKTRSVPEPGCLKINMSSLDEMSRSIVEQTKSSQDKTNSEIESLHPWAQSEANTSISIVEKILTNLEMHVATDTEDITSYRKRSPVDTLLERFIKSETEKYLIKVLKKTVGWHLGHLIRDVTESMIAHAGLKRSKYWSLSGFHQGNVLLVMLPSKSLEVSNAHVRFILVHKEGFGCVDPDNIDSKKSINGVIWIYSKPMTLDLNRLLALNICFEKAFLATAVWFQYFTEDQGMFPLQSSIKSVFAYKLLLAMTQKMKVCALFDNLRYLIPSCTASYSGAASLIEKFVKRPFKSSLEVYVYIKSKELLISLAQNNKFRYYSKVRMLGLTVDQSSVGATGIYPSLVCHTVYRHYRSLISEITTCFFLFEKGLHGTMTEEAKIHLETVEWANNFKEKEAKYGKDLVEFGYTIEHLINDEIIPEQQLYCKNVIKLATLELNKVLTSKSQVISNSIMNKHWEEPYFSQTRNISLKGMSGELQEDGHLASSYTLIEAIRYLNKAKRNPTVLELYNETRDIRAQARIVRKHQRTEADRGFFITTLPTRVRLEIIEDYFDSISKNVQEEYISYGGEKKILQIQGSLEKALRWASGTSTISLSTGDQITFKRKLMYVSADATKWSPGDNSAKFRLFTSHIHDGLKDRRLKHCVIDALKGIYETEFFISRRLRGYIENMEELEHNVQEFLDFFDYSKGRSGLVRGNWLQGNLNKCSSLFSVAISFLFKEIWSRLFPELDCFIEFAHHSDDALFIYGYLEPEGDGSDWYLYVTQKIQAGELYWHSVNTEMWKTMFNMHEYLLLLGSVKVSPKKTTVSPTNAEFLSTFFEGCAVSIPFSKILLGALSDLPGLGFFDDLAASQSRCVKALDMGASPQVAQLAVNLTNSKVERLYGTAPGMANNPCNYIDLDRDKIPICLGGIGSSSILELATAGIGMSDKLVLKNALISFRHTKQLKDKYILGIYKFLMLLAQETFQHERLGEFSFLGKVQWKVFIPKNEFEFSNLFSINYLNQWSSEHPVYDYIIPQLRDDLLVYLVRKLNDPSIVTAMTLQSPLQLRFRMQAKQHLPVCKYNDNWVTFRTVLAAAHEYASKYIPNEIDLDLFNTLVSCTFSKEFAWKDFISNTECEVILSRKIHRAKVARVFTVKERDQIIQNPISVVIAYKFAVGTNEIKDVLDKAKFPDSLSSDLKLLYEGVYRELGLDINDPSVMKRVAPMLYKTSRSRIVIVNGNVEGTAESICTYWLRSISFVKQIKIIPHAEVLKAVSIFSKGEFVQEDKQLAALRLCIEIWRWGKYNRVDINDWFAALWFEGKTLWDWLYYFQRKGVPLVDPEIQCAGLMMYDLLRDMTCLQMHANRRAYSGKQYDAYCMQTYNEETKLYEGDLRVVFNFGIDCARLEIFWEKQTYVLETSITSKPVLRVLMQEVSTELQRCGLKFDTVQSMGFRSVVLFKTDSGFEWGKPNVPCIIFKNCALRPTLRNKQVLNKEFIITILDNGFKAIAQQDLDSNRFQLAHAYHNLRDIRYQALETVNTVNFTVDGKVLYLNPIIAAGLIENFMKGLPAVIPPQAYSLIMKKAKITVDLFMFNKLLALINPENTFNMEGIESDDPEYSSVTTLSVKEWAEEKDIEDAEVEDDEYVIDLNDIDFDKVDTLADIQHFLQDESAYTADLVIDTESVESKRVRGIVKLLEPIKLIKSWVSKGLAIEKIYDPLAVILVTRYFSKQYSFSKVPLAQLDPYNLTELESIVRGWGELVCDQFYELDQQAHAFIQRTNKAPEDLTPDSLFSFRHAELLFSRLFLPDTVSVFY